jgi:hypothetical protein
MIHADITPAQKESLDRKSIDAIQIGGDHYNTMAIEPWEVLESVLTREEWIGFLKGTIIKYSMRQGRKDEADDDAAKARHYSLKLRTVMQEVSGI